ncbi:hypothetical protein VB774_02535 [Pseudanabaena galeata UHCC 0370]|uniref:Uncharacterized protein n=1 Tax=Pseudanabaena galeata UHCC 0370 TaxID=3110310 RepID=A0ABU5TDZ2_9CYAN|nr:MULTISPECIES: hypothetical protein [Pseudanabaena]MEA5476486.1 hypothetical protein [Pseudanabaena galeata UHCC 0370]
MPKQKTARSFYVLKALIGIAKSVATLLAIPITSVIQLSIL